MISKNSAACSGKSKLLQEPKKNDANISIQDAEEWLESQLAYTSDKPIRQNKTSRGTSNRRAMPD